jgi:hypothetical protein
MITWSSLSLPPLNLWNYPDWRYVPETSTIMLEKATFVREVKHIHGVSVAFIYKDKR